MGDMIAQDALYHVKCLSSLYRVAAKKQFGGNYSKDEKKIHRVVLAELVTFIKQSSIDETTTPVFKLMDLAKNIR